ncbi:MAG TPA: hypothetical protein VFZ09_37465 [Archangium sp.]|uniref:hypothetical protein n=1 Tax=Archangium sp. TaxID=1872627 RepID=UPI002E30B80A|nr:hypothetical protein [Archangium sp.]HEX5751971.1 hypothetical protein [Archangium sp.]
MMRFPWMMGLWVAGVVALGCGEGEPPAGGAPSVQSQAAPLVAQTDRWQRFSVTVPSFDYQGVYVGFDITPC